MSNYRVSWLLPFQVNDWILTSPQIWLNQSTCFSLTVSFLHWPQIHSLLLSGHIYGFLYSSTYLQAAPLFQHKYHFPNRLLLLFLLHKPRKSTSGWCLSPHTRSALRYAIVSDTKTCFTLRDEENRQFRGPHAEYPLTHLFLKSRWVGCRFVLSIPLKVPWANCHPFWCSTKLPVLQYSLLCRCYRSRLITTITKQTRKYSVHRSFVSNINISKTRIQARLRGQSTKHGWTPSHEAISTYIHRLICQQTLDRSCCMIPACIPQLLYPMNYMEPTGELIQQHYRIPKHQSRMAIYYIYFDVDTVVCYFCLGNAATANHSSSAKATCSFSRPPASWIDSESRTLMYFQHLIFPDALER